MSEEQGIYGPDEDNSNLEYFSSGCTLCNCILGGGWALRRASQVYGDSQSGKSLEGIETTANFRLTYPKGIIKVIDSESAFEEGYSRQIGLPQDAEYFGNGEIKTIEALYKLVNNTATECTKKDVPGLIVVDTIDGISDETELKTDISDGSYGMKKQKKLNELFRRLISVIKSSRMHLMLISQLKEKPGIVYGSKDYTSGGRAIEYFVSQRLKLKHKGYIKPVKKGISRVTGINVMATCTKNRLGPAFRSVEFDIIFGSGINSVQASVNWLAEIKRMDILEQVMPLQGVTVKDLEQEPTEDDSELIENEGVDKKSVKSGKKWIAALNKLPNPEYSNIVHKLDEKVIVLWDEIEAMFTENIRRKYP